MDEAVELTERVKILVLCYEYPPLGGGGGRIAKAVAEKLAARGHEVRVQTAALGWRSTRERGGGVEVFRTASLRRREDTCAVHEMALYCATSFFPTLRHIAAWKPDVIHAHFAMPTGLLAWAVHSLTGVRYVLTAHLGDVPGGVPEQTAWMFRIVDPLARRVWARASARTAVSSFVQRLAEDAYGAPVVRILNGIDLGDGLPAPVSTHEEPHFIFVGRFSPQKQPQLFIEALAEIASLEWKATLVGDGPLRQSVQDCIARHGLGHRVRLAGWLPARAVHDVLATGDALVLPSLSEGLPVAGIEALQHGLALVVSDSPGMQDILEPGVNGFAFAIGDSAALAQRLRWLIGNRAALLAMKHASWQRAREFDLGAIAEAYERVLLAAQKGARRDGLP